MTKNPGVRVAKSIVDYTFRWMATKFLSPEAQFRVGVNNVRSESEALPDAVKSEIEQLTLGETAAEVDDVEPNASTDQTTPYAIQNDQDAPPCSTCGAIMIRNGACYKCVNCGATSGCA